MTKDSVSKEDSRMNDENREMQEVQFPKEQIMQQYATSQRLMAKHERQLAQALFPPINDISRFETNLFAVNRRA